MSRPLDDSSDSQKYKYVAFRTAYGLVKHYEETQNYLAAYVIAFSILEDRVKAMYVICYRNTQNGEPTTKILEEGFRKLVSKLVHHQYICKALADELANEAEMRNQLLHTAMWKLDAFTPDTVTRIKSLVRLVEKLHKAKKKELKLSIQN